MSFRQISETEVWPTLQQQLTFRNCSTMLRRLLWQIAQRKRHVCCRQRYRCIASILEGIHVYSINRTYPACKEWRLSIAASNTVNQVSRAPDLMEPTAPD